MTTEDGATTGAAVTAHRYLRIRVAEWFGREDFQRWRSRPGVATWDHSPNPTHAESQDMFMTYEYVGLGHWIGSDCEGYSAPVEDDDAASPLSAHDVNSVPPTDIPRDIYDAIGEILAGVPDREGLIWLSAV